MEYNKDKSCFYKDVSLFDKDLEKRFIDGMAEFAAGVGHELNNPLAVISGLAQTLLVGEDDVNRRRSLLSIIDQTGRAYEMITSIRSFSRPPKPELKDILLIDFFRDWTRREQERYCSSEVLLTTSYNDCIEDLVLTTDPAILGAILEVFSRNAYDSLRFRSVDLNHTLRARVEGCVAIFVSVDIDDDGRQHVILGTEDNGPGLTIEARELAFSPFYSSRQAGRGLGVGLAKAWRYAETLGATVKCESSSQFNTGCRWSVSLPLSVL